MLTIKKFFLSLVVWIALSGASLLSGAALQYFKGEYWLAVSGSLIIIFGTVLCAISHVCRPKEAVLAEIEIDQEGNRELKTPGEEYGNHNLVGLLLVVIGTSLTLAGSVL